MKRYEVLEDNAGGLTLVVFDNDGNVEYLHMGYEHRPKDLLTDLEVLKQGANPKDEWDGNDDTPQETYNGLKEFMGVPDGIQVVADSDGIYSDLMGYTAHEEFGLED